MEAEAGQAAIQDKGIQCELLRDPSLGPTDDFDILDKKLRRKLVRRVYLLLILETTLTIPCLELLLAFPLPETSFSIHMVFCGGMLILYTVLYVFREWRRFPPFNYLVFILTFCTTKFSLCLYLLQLDKSRWMHLYPVAFIIEMITLILYSNQDRFKFTHARGVVIIYLIFGLIVFGGFWINWVLFLRLLVVWGCTFEAWYVIYDTYLILSGYHAYNLGPHEYIYAVCNIHIDLPKFAWIIMINLVFSPIRSFLKFFRKCRTTSIC